MLETLRAVGRGGPGHCEHALLPGPPRNLTLIPIALPLPLPLPLPLKTILRQAQMTSQTFM